MCVPQAGKGRTGIMICCLLLYLHKNAPDLANVPAASAAAAVAAGMHPAMHAAGDRAGSGQQQAAAGANQQAIRNSSIGSASAQQRMLGGQQQYSSRLWHPWQCVPPVELRQLDQPVQDILDMYAERRTHDGNGVTIKSQRRCVDIWDLLGQQELCGTTGATASSTHTLMTCVMSTLFIGHWHSKLKGNGNAVTYVQHPRCHAGYHCTVRPPMPCTVL